MFRFLTELRRLSEGAQIMWKRSDGLPARLLVTALVLVGVMAIGVAAASAGKSDPKPSGPSASDPAAGFVGNETCATCHESEAKSMEHSLHGKAQDSRTPSAKAGGSCESCHGPGQKHVDSGNKADIRRFNAISA